MHKESKLKKMLKKIIILKTLIDALVIAMALPLLQCNRKLRQPKLTSLSYNHVQWLDAITQYYRWIDK